MAYPPKEIFRNFLSVVAGVSVALIIIIPSSIFGGLLGFSDSRISKFQEILSSIIVIAGTMAGTFLGGYTTAKISTKKTKVHVCITAMVLIFLFLLFSEFEKAFFTSFEIIILLILFPSTFCGGIYSIKIKQSHSDKLSFPPDNPLQ